MQIEAAVLRSRNAPLSVETLELAPPQTGEVLIEMRASGVCHSDWHCVTGDSAIDLPAVLGHEGSGIVRELGPGVPDLAVGDHVALSWIPACGACLECHGGLPNLCQTYLPNLWAGLMPDGTRRMADLAGEPVFHLAAISTWASHSVVPAVSCVRMPDVPFEISALIGCGVTTGVGAVRNKAKVRPGQTVAVFGGGGVGISTVMGAVLAGAREIIVVDRNPEKDAMCRGFGATEVIITDDLDRAVAEIRRATGGRGVDHVFDAVGLAPIEAVLLDCLAPAGTAVLVGIPAGGTSFAVEAAEFIRQEKVLTGSIFGSADTARDFVEYAEHYLEGQLPLDRLVTQRYALEEINEACAAMLSGSTGRGVIVF
ncbi:MAG: zinc-binding dehydrogenase [Actinomycetota bacterium]